MPIFDFKEIPEPHVASGIQDAFELFARDFLKYLRFDVVDPPSRGADGGKDLIIVEKRTGIIGETTFKWLVSCKHKAHSGNSVGVSDEVNITDRVAANNCHGFVGFYSTLPSSGLTNILRGLHFEYKIFDWSAIENELVKSADGLLLAQRFFPKSIANWRQKQPPSKVFVSEPHLLCQYCGKDLLNPRPTGIVVLWHTSNPTTSKKTYTDIHWCCKGQCDKILESKIRKPGLTDGWEDISDLTIPTVYARWIIVPLNQLANGHIYQPPAFEKLKHVLVAIFPFVARHPSAGEEARISALRDIPDGLGGISY